MPKTKYRKIKSLSTLFDFGAQTTFLSFSLSPSHFHSTKSSYDADNVTEIISNDLMEKHANFRFLSIISWNESKAMCPIDVS